MVASCISISIVQLAVSMLPNILNCGTFFAVVAVLFAGAAVADAAGVAVVAAIAGIAVVVIHYLLNACICVS